MTVSAVPKGSLAAPPPHLNLSESVIIYIYIPHPSHARDGLRDPKGIARCPAAASRHPHENLSRISESAYPSQHRRVGIIASAHPSRHIGDGISESTSARVASASSYYIYIYLSRERCKYPSRCKNRVILHARVKYIFICIRIIRVRLGYNKFVYILSAPPGAR